MGERAFEGKRPFLKCSASGYCEPGVRQSGGLIKKVLAVKALLLRGGADLG
jgi:hypothetical protein